MRPEHWIYALPLRLRSLFRRKDVDRDLEDELRDHLERRATELVAAGLGASEAREKALREFGGVEQAKEKCRDERRVSWIQDWIQDVQYGLRLIQKAPGFNAVAILTLALGISAATAIFSVVDAALLQAVPYASADRLVIVRERIPQLSPKAIEVSAPDVAVIARENRVFERVAAFENQDLNLSGGGEPERIRAARVSANLFATLNARPAVGRTFAEEEKPGHFVAILSYGLWNRRFGGDPNVVGRRVVLGGQIYTVIGAMPRGFEFPPSGMPGYETADVWVPIAFTREELGNLGDNFDVGVLAKLKSGVTLARAQVDMDLIAASILKSWGPEAVRAGITVEGVLTPFREVVVSEIRPLVYLLLAAVGLLLLISCANVANLLLSRGAVRQKEIALRVALGARRGRIVRQLLTESLVLAVIGGALGIVLTIWAARMLVAIAPDTIPQAQGIAIDTTVLAFAAIVSICAGLSFGLAPAIVATRADLNETLKEGGRGHTGQRSAFTRNAFVVAQVAMAFVLVVTAGLLLRSFLQAERTNSGVRAQNVTTATIALDPQQYSNFSRVNALFEQVFTRMTNAAYFDSIGAASDLPTEMSWNHVFSVEGHPVRSTGVLPLCAHTLVLGNYFRALGVPLLRGRLFSATEEKGQSGVVIISSRMAKQRWGEEDPIGKRLKWGPAESTSPWLTVVGVVGDVKQEALDAPTIPHTYAPYLQDCTSPGLSMCTTLNVAIRTSHSSPMVVSNLRAAVQAADPDAPLTRVRTMTEVLESSLASRKFHTFLMAVFAGAALLLAGIGLYGVLAFRVLQQTHEIGIRMTLGAQASAVVRRVLGDGFRLTLIGIAVGSVTSLTLTRLIRSLLFEVSAEDPWTLAEVSFMFVLVMLIACYVPARRAVRVDPMIALRHE